MLLKRVLGSLYFQLPKLDSEIFLGYFYAMHAYFNLSPYDDNLLVS